MSTDRTPEPPPPAPAARRFTARHGRPYTCLTRAAEQLLDRRPYQPRHAKEDTRHDRQ